MKMAVVGCEASGKTVFMCALSDYFGRSAANNAMRLKLTPENAAANNFERFQFRQMRCLRQWPPATPPDRTIEIKWSLRREGVPLAFIDMLEFGGETYRDAFRSPEDTKSHEGSVAELMKYLSDTDFVVVLVSIQALLADQLTITEEEYARETEALWVTRGLIEFIRKRRPRAGIVIGLTQADKYRNEIAQAGGPQQLFASRWPTLAAASENIPVVEVASVSQIDANGNPAENYVTNGVLPVMRIFSKYCFGKEDALESANGAPSRRLNPRLLKRWLKIGGCIVAFAAIAALVGFLALKLADRKPATVRTEAAFGETVVIEKVVTNMVTKVVEKPVTKVVEKVVTEVVEKPVTNTVEVVLEQVVEKIVKVPVTNTVEVVVEKVVTNTIEKIVEKAAETPAVTPEPATAATVKPMKTLAEKPSEEPTEDVPAGFRVWTDYNGRKIVAKWTGIAVDQSGITIVTRFNRRIDAVLWKFSEEDQNYIKSEIKRHADKDEFMVEGKWVRNPMLKKN